MICLFDTFFISGKQNENRARWKIASGTYRKIGDPDNTVYIENSPFLAKIVAEFLKALG